VPAALSIVIPSHCRPDLLRYCLASLIRHAPAGTEIIVVDDGSAEAAISRAAQEFAGVHVLRQQRARGFCAAANRGIQAATAPILELLNDDTEVTAGWAHAALAHFADARIGAVAPLVLRAPANGAPPRIDSAGDRYYIGGVAAKRGHGEPLGDRYLQPCDVFGASGSSAFYRRDALLRIGSFPEPFGAYFEDVDLAFRLHWAGYAVTFEPAARVWHRVSASYGRPGRRLLEQQALNEERVFWRNLAGRALREALPRHLAVLAAKVLDRCGSAELVPFVCGRLRILREIAELRRHHRFLRTLGPDDDVGTWQVERRYWGKIDGEAAHSRGERGSASSEAPNGSDSDPTRIMS